MPKSSERQEAETKKEKRKIIQTAGLADIDGGGYGRKKNWS